MPQWSCLRVDTQRETDFETVWPHALMMVVFKPDFMKNFLKRFCFAILFFFIFTAVVIIKDGLSDNKHKSAVIVVLGNKVELDGRPSLRLKSRLDTALGLYQDGYAPLFIVSGGLGKEGYNETIVMKEYLVAHGVPKEIVVLDQNGIDSFHTAQNTKLIMEELSFATTPEAKRHGLL